MAIACTIARPRPAPSLVRPPSARVKRSNAWDSNPGGNPAPVVRDLERDRPVVAPRGHADVTGPVPERVVDQVPERLLDPQDVDVRFEGRGDVDDDLPPTLARATREPGSNSAKQLVEVHPLALDRQLALIGPCDHEQVFGQP